MNMFPKEEAENLNSPRGVDDVSPSSSRRPRSAGYQEFLDRKASKKTPSIVGFPTISEIKTLKEERHLAYLAALKEANGGQDDLYLVFVRRNPAFRFDDYSWYDSILQTTLPADSQPQIINRYCDGFTAKLTQDEIKAIQLHPNVIVVGPNYHAMKLQLF